MNAGSKVGLAVQQRGNVFIAATQANNKYPDQSAVYVRKWLSEYSKNYMGPATQSRNATAVSTEGKKLSYSNTLCLFVYS